MTRDLARDILAFNIRDLCAERGLEAEALAQELGWDTNKLATAMSGAADINLDDLGHLAVTLRVPAHILLAAPPEGKLTTTVDMAPR